MSTLFNDFAEELVVKPEYKEASATLFKAYINSSVGLPSDVERKTVKQLLSCAQIFYKSDKSKIRQEGTALLSMLLDTCTDQYPDIKPIAQKVFTESGDFPNVDLLELRTNEIEYEQSYHDAVYADIRRSINQVENLKPTLTDYQRKLWQDLVTGKDVITAAPTSAGKTFVILNYIVSQISEADGAFAAILVPTRALIAEVTEKVYNLAKQYECIDSVEVCTTAKDDEYSDRTIFVMTQERLHEVLLSGDLSFDYLFIDEAHNIADSSRGVLLHLTLEMLLKDSSPQTIISMPSAKYQNSFSTIFSGADFRKEITDHSPVAKILISVALKGRDILLSKLGSNSQVKIPKNFKKDDLADIALRLGEGQTNIIYRNRTDYCEKLAHKLAKRLDESASQDSERFEAADYIEKFIHADFSLAGTLKKGVAFHYGPLPPSVRTMIESLAKNDHLDFIVCTSTLAEGVNLPAKNLFLKNPAQASSFSARASSTNANGGSKRLEDVTMNNIMGRAGRMLQHFSGNIYLIDHDSWKYQDYFDPDDEDDAPKIPSYFRTINDESPAIINALRGNIDPEDPDKYRMYSIANKLIKELSDNELERALQADEITLNQPEIDTLKSEVGRALSSLNVPAFTLSANPTAGYIQQNNLHSFLLSLDSYEEWVLPHPKARDIYDRLVRITEKLYEFGIYTPIDASNLKYSCKIARKWVRGHSLKSMISAQIKEDASHGTENVDKSVKSIIKVINDDIRFRLSNGIKCYYSIIQNILISKEIDLKHVKLHSYIEIGACDDLLVKLISFGLTREAAKDIEENLPDKVRLDSPEDLIMLMTQASLSGIHKVTAREIRALFN